MNGRQNGVKDEKKVGIRGQTIRAMDRRSRNSYISGRSEEVWRIFRLAGHANAVNAVPTV